MAETTADVRRDIELTRERMTSTLAQLEQKLNLTQVIRDHPWPAVGLALGAGFLLSGSGADVKAAHATRSLTSTARDGTRSRLGPALDDALSRLMLGLSEAVNYQIDRVVEDVQRIVGLPADRQSNGDGHRLAGAAREDGDRGEHRGPHGDATPPTSNPYTGSAASWSPATSGEMGRAD